MVKSNKIPILTQITDESNAALPRLGRNALSELQIVEVDGTTLSENLRLFLAKFEPVLAVQPNDIAGYHIDEVELSLTVNASGGIELVGKATAGVEAGIKIKLKRGSL